MLAPLVAAYQTHLAHANVVYDSPTRRILLIDDDPDDRSLARVVLTGELGHFEVHEVPDAELWRARERAREVGAKGFLALGAGEAPEGVADGATVPLGV